MARNFIVFAPSFNENTGGYIALHRLCDLLNAAGQRAWLWPTKKPRFDARRPRAMAREFSMWQLRVWLRRYRRCSAFRTPIASHRHLRGAIVIYPEIIHGNPLRAKNVVRWLLHKPGFHTGGSYDYGSDDHFFFYQKAFDDPLLNVEGDNLLRAVWVRDDIYRQTNFGPRSGTCYFVRKGKGRPLVHDLTDSIMVDYMSHTELAAIFNRVTACISYDPYTMYSQFAALCGCDSIVVPEEGVSKEQWYPDPADRYGVAYGFDDIEHARQTRPLLLAHLHAQETSANASVEAFIAKCAVYFPE